ncbi:MAG: hypothetical protein QM698_02450 [Micropepsaceae bacterium]
MLRFIVHAAAAVTMAVSTLAFADADPRATAALAAMPAEIEGYTRSMDDMTDVSEEDKSVNVMRMLNSPKANGPVILQVRLWTAEDTEADAEKMLDPDGLEILKATIVDVNGYPAFFMPGAMAVYPGRPDSGVTVMVSGLTDSDEAARLAALFDYDALLAIE